jgi:DNA invertase Pin-like site-specific DNA recombinase
VFRAYDDGHPELATGKGVDARIVRDSKRQRLTEAEIAEAENLLNAGNTTAEVADQIGCSQTTVSRIRNRSSRSQDERDQRACEAPTLTR